MLFLGLMVKERYKELAAKYKLPPFELLNGEFEISTLDDDEFLLRNIKKRVQEHLETVQEYLSQILLPNPDSVVDMHECRYVSAEAKEKAFELFKKTQSLIRSLQAASFSNEPAEDTILLSKLVAEWPVIKSDVVPLLRMLKDAWQKDIDYKEELAYFG